MNMEKSLRMEMIEGVQNIYTLSTDTTTVSLTAATDGLYITSLHMKEGSANGTEYVSEPAPVPMVAVINQSPVTWVYESAAVSTVTDGKTAVGERVTAVYRSEDGGYKTELTATARAGVGPVEFAQTVTGLETGVSVTYADAVSSDLRICPDAETTLWSFGRLRVNFGGDPLFAAGGVVKTSLCNGNGFAATVENSCNAASGLLPYEVLDMGDHGVYFGYYWSFGQMTVSRERDRIDIRTRLGEETAAIEREVGEPLAIPAFFVGTYTGDADDGSNDMKHWYWRYKITRSLYEHEEEPYLSTCIDNGAIRVQELFEVFPDIANYINVLKYDYDWTIPPGAAFQGECVGQERQWLPHPWVKATVGDPDQNRWQLYEFIKQYAANDGIDADLKFSLYMPDTYQGGDLGTREGREAQLQALKDRFEPNDTSDSVGYDYWRSDFAVEAGNDYDSHEGLLYVLDHMIRYSDEFRYEHCSGGGSLKDFTSLERITFMTTEDYAMPLFHRQSLYTNTYMISPVQLRADINCLIDTEWGAGGRGYISVDENRNGIPAYTDPEYVDYFLRTCMLGTGLVTFSIDGFRKNLDRIKYHCDLYNHVQRKILRDCNVYHILNAPTGYDYDDWDGIMYYNDRIDKGVVQLFKCNSEVGGVAVPSERTILLKGLDADTGYTLTFIDRTEQNCVMTGAELMNTGLHVTGMTEKYDSEIIYIEPCTAG